MKTTTEIDLPFENFPHYISAKAKIVKDENASEGGTVSVTVYSSVHVTREKKMGMNWSYRFFRDKHAQFMNDVRSFIIKFYGLQWTPGSYY